MLKVEKLDVTINGNHILKNMNFEVKEGERIAIIGPSGCGKSTLLRTLNGLQDPTKGKILFKDMDINDPKEEIGIIGTKLGMIFQQFNLFPHLTILKNITLAPVKLKLLTEEEAIKKAKVLLKKVNLADKEDFYPHELSGGQMQRVAIARTLIMEPEIILADEPTSALDPEMVGEVMEILKRIGEKGKTMIVVTHEMKFIEEFATRVIFIDKGEIIEDATSEEILHKPKTKRLKEFLSQIND